MVRKNERTSAAIVGLLDAIKSEGLMPVNGLGLEKINNASAMDKHVLTNSSEKVTDYSIAEIDTSDISPWYMANRLNEYISQDSCADLIESIKLVGQQIPALVRKHKSTGKYELICGARRLFACNFLNRKLKVAIVNLSDKEALLAMDAENRPREDISPYERALDYKNWIDKGIYKNQAEICGRIGIKKSLFTQIFALSSLDENIVKAFGHPNNLTIKWGYQLARLSKDLNNKVILLKKAKELCNSNKAPSLIYRELLNSLQNLKQAERTKQYINRCGDVTLEINSDGRTIKLSSKTKISPTTIEFLIKQLELSEKKV